MKNFHDHLKVFFILKSSQIVMKAFKSFLKAFLNFFNLGQKNLNHSQSKSKKKDDEREFSSHVFSPFSFLYFTQSFFHSFRLPIAHVEDPWRMFRRFLTYFHTTIHFLKWSSKDVNYSYNDSGMLKRYKSRRYCYIECMFLCGIKKTFCSTMNCNEKI